MFSKQNKPYNVTYSVNKNKFIIYINHLSLKPSHLDINDNINYTAILGIEIDRNTGL